MARPWAPAVVNMTRQDIFLLSGLVVAGVLIYISLSRNLSYELYDNATYSDDPGDLLKAYSTTLQALEATSWIMGATMVLAVMLGVQFFILWSKALTDAKTKAELQARRETYGISYVTVLDDGENNMVEQFAPVVARLAGT